jgi:RNA polymerase sigma-70 factor, ECF subfamily
MTITGANLDQAFLTFEKNLKAYLYRLTAHREDTEDLLQETYVQARQNIHQFNGSASLKTWIYAIATNKARDHWRVRKRWSADAQDACREVAETQPGQRARILDAFQSQTDRRFEIKEHINYCLTCLSKNLELDQQIAVILSEFFEFKRRDIADVLGRTEGVVKHLLFEGRKSLQAKHFNRCALINKNGTCYQCAELSDFFNTGQPAAQQVAALKLPQPDTLGETGFDRCLEIARSINPPEAQNSRLHDTLLQVLQDAIG